MSKFMNVKGNLISGDDLVYAYVRNDCVVAGFRNGTGTTFPCGSAMHAHEVLDDLWCQLNGGTAKKSLVEKTPIAKKVKLGAVKMVAKRGR